MQQLKWTVSGIVEHGEGYGRKLGFPTANLDRNDYLLQKLNAPFGVYGGWSRIGKEKSIYKSAIVIGPEDASGLPKIESHLLGFAGDLYGQLLTLEISEFIRPFRNFDSETELINQIKIDIKAIEAIL